MDAQARRCLPPAGGEPRKMDPMNDDSPGAAAEPPDGGSEAGAPPEGGSAAVTAEHPTAEQAPAGQTTADHPTAEQVFRLFSLPARNVLVLGGKAEPVNDFETLTMNIY